MTAEQARQIADESSKIMEDISKAAFEGKKEIIVYSLSNPVNQGLQKLGYTIRRTSGGINETTYKISW